MNRSLLLFICTCLFLQGCQTVTQTKPEPPPEQAEYIPGEFNQESLYALMLAEIAGQRRLFPVALENYLEQARKTRDPGVAERATRIAQYLRNADKIIESAHLWRDISPENPEPYQLEANLLLHKGQYEDALPLIQKAMEYDALRTLALIRSQYARIEPSVLDGYLRMLETYQHSNPPRADLALTLALLYKAAGDNPRSLAEFNRALTLEPENPEALVQKAEFLRAEQDLKGALTLIQSAFEQQPENRQLHILYTQLLFQTQNNAAGVAQAEQLLKHNIQDHQLTYYLALLLLENEALGSAKQALNRLLELKPEDSSPHFYLGHIAQAQEQEQTALNHYIQVLDGPNVIQALSRVSLLLKEDTDRDQIQKIFANTRELLPDRAPEIYTLEAEWLNLHNYAEEAQSLLEEALTLFPDSSTLLYTRAMMIESFDFPQAEIDLRRILEADPDNATVQNALGYTLLLHTERFEEALQLIQAALNQEPEDPAILDSMGWALFKLGRAGEAIPYLEKAYALYSDPEVASHLIQAYWQAGQKLQARALFQQSQQEHPENPFLDEAAQILND